jgi:hypothetical protein
MGRIPLYLGPGTTRLTMYDSTIKGRSDSVALYLDAESGFNIIRNNTFDITSASREIIAVDGSANNQLLANAIKKAPNGGIYLYRNCGEGGTVRHQSPQNNFIAGNTINNTGGYGIWLGSRNGGRCIAWTMLASPLAAARTMVTLPTTIPSETTLLLTTPVQ